ncbi:MAG: sensor histidine kinase [Mycoplasma sp.]
MNKNKIKSTLNKITTKINLIIFAIMIVFTVVMLFVVDVKSFESQSDLWRMLIAPILIVFLICIIINMMLYFLVTKKIKKLVAGVREVEAGNYDVKVEIKSDDEIGELTRNFNEMASEIKSNEYTNKEFFKHLTHEFKTPINTINGYASLIEKKSDGQVNEFSKIIIEETKRLSNLTFNILELSKLDAEYNFNLNESVNIGEIIKKSIKLLQPEIDELNLTIIDSVTKFKIKSNHDLCFQMIHNIISNALKYSKQNGTIEISLSENAKNTIKISDNGIGIKEKDKQQIFNQFFSTNSNKVKSSGLGLSIVKKISNIINVDISFDSKLNRGTTFYLAFPEDIKKN